MVDPEPAVYEAAPAPAPPAPAMDVAPGTDAVAQAAEPPPPLPEYEQPPCPADGWLWTPGYWAYSAGGYYWIPGTWVMPPQPGLLWTPGYWAFAGGLYVFHAGYWAPHVGFYGGINYGFGYTGDGFVGGRWDGNRFAYNRSVTNVNITVVHNTYNEYVVRNVAINHVSYNGGREGTAAAPSVRDRETERESHVVATDLQRQHVHEAARNPALYMRANAGHPDMGATPRAAAFARDYPPPLDRRPPAAASAENAQRIDHQPYVEQGRGLAPRAPQVTPAQPAVAHADVPSGAANSQGVDHEMHAGQGRGLAPRAPQVGPPQPPVAHPGLAAGALPQSTPVQRPVGPMQRPQGSPAAAAAQPMPREMRPARDPHAGAAANAPDAPHANAKSKDRPKNELKVNQQ
jgi:hypothetical protein